MELRNAVVDPWAAVPGIVAVAVMVGLKITVYPDAFASVGTIVLAGVGGLVLGEIFQYVLTRYTSPARRDDV
ncbi:MAG: hypothetical protein ACI9YT_001066 [Halobacteriales archaeon]|jgi:hypothetical protein